MKSLMSSYTYWSEIDQDIEKKMVKACRGCQLAAKTPAIETSLAFAGPSGIRAGWGIEINGRFEAERPPASAEPPSSGRAATFVPYV